MRKFFMFLLLTLLICGSFGIAGAVPMYYTFQGTITSIENNNGSIPVGVGDMVAQVWIIDLEASGYDTLINGSITDYPDTADYDYFYVDYFSGLNVDLTGPGAFDEPGDVAEFNRGYTYQDTFSRLIGESANERIWLSNETTVISDWSVGSFGFVAYQTLSLSPIDDVAIYDRWWSENMELISITDVPYDGAPVPEPATILLFGLGILGLAGVSRKK